MSLMVNKIFLHATYNCNANCVHCAVPKAKTAISKENFNRVVNMARKENTEYLVIGGGEPMMHPNILNMVEYAADNGLKVKIETNGMLLTKEKLEVLSKSIFQINISMDGINSKTHNKIRQANAFNNAIEGITYARQLGIDVAIWSVIMRDNANEALEIISLAKSLGVNKVSFLYATPVGAGYKNKDKILMDPIKYYEMFRAIKSTSADMQIRIAPYTVPFDKIHEFEKEYLPEIGSVSCMIYDKSIIHIDPEGDIFPCVLLLHRKEFSMGNVARNNELSRILRWDDNKWAMVLRSLDSHKADAKKEGYEEAGCIGLCLASNTKIDERMSHGLPICPSKTITKEWDFKDKK